MFSGFSGEIGQTCGADAARIRPATPMTTILGAMTRLDELNKRLNILSICATKLAHGIGGPFPSGGPDQKQADAPTPSCNTAQLHNHLDCAHRHVAEIDQALRMMQRAVGGPE